MPEITDPEAPVELDTDALALLLGGMLSRLSALHDIVAFLAAEIDRLQGHNSHSQDEGRN